MVDRAVPYRSIDRVGNHYDAWHAFWQEQFAVSQGGKIDHIGSYDLQTKITAFVALCDSVLKHVRGYLITKNDQALLSRFESDTCLVPAILRERISSLRGKERTKAIIEILAVAMQSIDLAFIKNKPSYVHRLCLVELSHAVEELELIGDRKVPPTLAPVTITAAKPLANSSGLTFRPSLSHHKAQVPHTQTRRALGAAFATFVTLGLVRIGTSSEGATQDIHLEPTHYSGEPARREPLYRPANFIRHTGQVIEPVRPHQSIVYPSLVRFFGDNDDQLFRCFTHNTVQITNAAELARWITDNPDHRVHTMLERLSRRPDKHFTVWWTDNCSEIVFATGVRTDFLSGEIRPAPVTLMVPVRE